MINAHGGLIYLQEEVAIGAELVLVNPATEEKQDCRVVYVDDTSDKGMRAGVEFLSPRPHFWASNSRSKTGSRPVRPRPLIRSRAQTAQ